MKSGQPAFERLLNILLSLYLITGCTTDKVRFAPVPGDMADATNPESSAVSERQSRRTIVVTMTDSAHQELTGGRPINMMRPKGPVTRPEKYQRYLNQLQRDYGISTVADWPLQSLGVRCFVFEVIGGQNRDQVIKALKQDPRIETVQAMQKFYTLAGSYNDPYAEVQTNLDTLAISESHRWATGKGVTVAVIDTGVDDTHEDLSGQTDLQMNFVDSNRNVFRNDLHGTAVAGIIAAKTNNASGIVGIAPDARIMPLKACWQTEAGSIKAACSSFTLAKSLNFAIMSDVAIINLSLAGPPDPLLERLVSKALGKHITVIAAASPNHQHSFPSAINGVMSVDETEKEPVSEKSGVDLLAPGHRILSLKPGNQYDFYSGSSFSTAQVAGLTALVKERKPHLSSDKIHALLQATQTKTRDPRTQQQTVNACRALARLVNAECGA